MSSLFTMNRGLTYHAGSAQAKIPCEIWSMIFVLCLPPQPPLAPGPRMGPRRRLAPLSLTAVCRQWRLVALDTSQLWRYLHINLCSTPMHWDDRTLMEFAVVWFARSGIHRPLVFSVNRVGRRDLLGSYAVPVVLLYFSSRLQHIHLFSDRPWILYPISVKPDAFPVLESAAFSSVPMPSINSVAAPRLRTMFIDRILQLDLAGWPALTYLNCGMANIHHLRLVFKNVPTLERFSVGILASNMWLPVPGTVLVHHNRLQQLILRSRSSVFPLSYFRFPKLRVLAIKDDLNYERELFGGFVQAAMPALRSLYLDFPAGYTAFLLLQKLPFLVELHVSNPDVLFTLNFFLELNGRNLILGHLLPRLEQLTFQNCTVQLCSTWFRALANRSRDTAKTARLRCFRFVWPQVWINKRLDDRTLDSVTALGRQGMKIFVGAPAHHVPWE
ncbi:unnamed protein product [Mycena citricolor]|uniref:F-box domain-containing protein n=1 Tax=Mycena citricolor TaxID=2018698 RepID=A0AAD2H393_9AGAR|nr:unnamed protein product [Mycena citricolor]